MTKKKKYIFAVLGSIAMIVLIHSYCQGINSISDRPFSFQECEYEYHEEGFDVYLLYPQIINSEDDEKEKRINQLIREDIKKVVEVEWEIHPSRNETFDITVRRYEIKYMDENLISIAYSARSGYIGTTGYVTTMYATTIDIENEKVLELDDVVDDFDALYDQLRNDLFIHITAWDGETGNYKMSTDYYDDIELKEVLLNGGMEWYVDEENFVIVSLEWQGMGVGYNEYARNRIYLKEMLKDSFFDFLSASIMNADLLI